MKIFPSSYKLVITLDFRCFKESARSIIQVVLPKLNYPSPKRVVVFQELTEQTAISEYRRKFNPTARKGVIICQSGSVLDHLSRREGTYVSNVLNIYFKIKSWLFLRFYAMDSFLFLKLYFLVILCQTHIRHDGSLLKRHKYKQRTVT